MSKKREFDYMVSNDWNYKTAEKAGNETGLTRKEIYEIFTSLREKNQKTVQDFADQELVARLRKKGLSDNIIAYVVEEIK